MNEIINILMRRDGISENEARTIIYDCITALEDAIGNNSYAMAEDIVYQYLNLEPDFLDILLNEMIWGKYGRFIY